MNRSRTTRFAPLGLAIAGLAALTAGALFIIEQRVTLAIQVSLAVVVLGLAVFVLFDPKRIRAALTGRQARYGSNALVMTLAFLGILIVLNYLAFTNSRQWDLTEDRQNSLMPESLQVLERLESPVQANAYFSPQLPAENARSLLQLYKNNSAGKFDFQFIDPITNPQRANADQVTRDGTIVLTMEERTEPARFSSEEEITGALVRLANPGERAIYFLTGHGEFPIDASNEENYNLAFTDLTAKNYTVNTLNLLATPQIPEDARVLIVAGPTKPLSDAELDLIRAYQQQGGALVYLADPRAGTQFGDQPDPVEKYLLETWGIRLDDNMIVDPSSTQSVVTISQRFTDHAITRRMASLALVLPVARSVSTVESPPDVQLSPLAYTSDMAWGETSIEGIEQNQVQPDAGVDLLGPVPLAVAGVNNTTSARIVVVGDSDFGGSRAYPQYGNSDFLLNSIDWAAEQENLISLTPRTPTQRMIVLPRTSTLGLILFSSVFLLPGLVIVMGIATWMQRRRQG
jgi:ABC-type uncharacterized transport system involved in gliding motility auxiliary subunit